VHSLQLFGDLFIQNISFQNQQPQQQQFVFEGKKMVGFWEMLAVAKWVGDVDCLGVSGKNAGCIINEANLATVCKIDAGWFGHGFHGSDWKITKHINVSPTDFISFDSICPSDKILFLKKMWEICNLTDNQIVTMTTFENQKLPKVWEELTKSDILENQRSSLKKQRDDLKELYKDDFLLLD